MWRLRMGGIPALGLQQTLQVHEAHQESLDVFGPSVAEQDKDVRLFKTQYQTWGQVWIVLYKTDGTNMK